MRLSGILLRMEKNSYHFIDTHAHIHYTMQKLNIEKLEEFQKVCSDALVVKGDENKYVIDAIVNVYCEVSKRTCKIFLKRK